MNIFNETDNALQTLCLYNGYKSIIDKIISDIEAYGAPHYEYEWGSEKYIIHQAIWVIITCKFGDYGMSPRFGWIGKDKEHDAIEYLIMLRGDDYDNERT